MPHTSQDESSTKTNDAAPPSFPRFILLVAVTAIAIAVVFRVILPDARLTTVEDSFFAIRAALSAYYVEHGTYPPAPGYRTADDAGGVGRGLRHYLADLDPVLFSDPYSDGGTVVYVPVNKKQLRIASRSWYAEALAAGHPGDPRPRDAETLNDTLAGMTFPPENYDSYVLISAGPNGDAGGIVYDEHSPGIDLNRYPEKNRAHVLGMATYFMASRDADLDTTGEAKGDDFLDFDYRERVKHGQALNPDNAFPDANTPPNSGPVILVMP